MTLLKDHTNETVDEVTNGTRSFQTPVYQYSTSEFIYDLLDSVSVDKNDARNKEMKFEDLLHARWIEARDNKSFNYNLNCIYKELDGIFNMSMQLNIERGELRRKPMEFTLIDEPFDHNRWNFTKLLQKEIMFDIKCIDLPISDNSSDRHIVAVNSSPLEMDHSLIIPGVNKCSNQVLTETAIRLATDVALLNAKPDFNILFNSLLGQASVNHLHLHCLYWPYKSDLINRKFSKLGNSNIYVIKPPQWICYAFAIQMRNKENYNDYQRNFYQCVKLLVGEGQAHNVFITRAPPIRTEGPDREESSKGNQSRYVTAYIFPRVNMIGAKPPANFNPAANELAGCLTSYTRQFYMSSNEAECVKIINEEALISNERFNKLYSMLSDILRDRKADSAIH